MRTLPTLSLLALLWGVVLLSPARAEDTRFVCDAMGDGYFMVTLFDEDPRTAFAYYQIGDGVPPSGPDGEGAIALPRVASGSGIRFDNGQISFHAKGIEGIVSSSGNSASCRGEPLPANTGRTGGTLDLLNLAGQSYGGKVRSGPGMEFSQIDSLAEGERIIILHNTRVEMNGYDWFLISHSGGIGGYQWGGLICAQGRQVPGAYRPCD